MFLDTLKTLQAAAATPQKNSWLVRFDVRVAIILL